MGENSVLNGKVGSIKLKLTDAHKHGWSYVHDVINTTGDEVSPTLSCKRFGIYIHGSFVLSSNVLLSFVTSH